MKSTAKEDKNEFNHANEFGESSEDTSGFFESSSTLNNETAYKCSTTSEHIASDGRLRSRKMQQQVSEWGEKNSCALIFHVRTSQIIAGKLFWGLNRFILVEIKILKIKPLKHFLNLFF